MKSLLISPPAAELVAFIHCEVPSGHSVSCQITSFPWEIDPSIHLIKCPSGSASASLSLSVSGSAIASALGTLID